MRYYGFQNEVKNYLNRLQKETSVVVTPAVAKTLNDRVESLKKSGIWKTYSLGFNDTDGDAYLSRAGVTDVIGRSEVLWFVRGMKALGLYSNMVAWPMRSYQNAGTGSTVYSLGGLGVYNGTIYNSMPWSANGMILGQAANHYITTSPAFFASHTLLYCLKRTELPSITPGSIQRDGYYISTGSVYRLVIQPDDTTFGVIPYYSGAFQYPGYSTSAFSSINQFSFNGYSLGETSYMSHNLVNENSTTAPSRPPFLDTATGSLALFGYANGVHYAKGLGSFYSLISKPTTNSQRYSIYLLHKSTLGSNLSLP